jgi:hypothetical protein
VEPAHVKPEFSDVITVLIVDPLFCRIVCVAPLLPNTTFLIDVVPVSVDAQPVVKEPPLKLFDCVVLCPREMVVD